MPLAVTNMATTAFKAQAEQAYRQYEYLTPDLYDLVSRPGGGKNFKFIVMPTITGAFTADGSDISAGGSTTPLGPTATTLDPLIFNETIPYSTLSDYGNYVAPGVSEALGRDCALRKSNTLLAFIARTANARGAAGQVELAGATGSTPTNSAFGDGLQAGIINLRNQGIDQKEMVAILRPEAYYGLRQLPQYASKDYTSGTDNTNINDRFVWGGVTIINASTVLGTNLTGNTGFPTAERVNLTNYWGVVYAKSALGVYETEKMSSEIVDIPHRQSWLAYTRTIFGYVSKQDAGMVALINAV